MDALFGLPRKKAAGVSHRPAVQGHLFFVEQSCVDEHVAGSKTHTLMKNVRPVIYYYTILCIHTSGYVHENSVGLSSTTNPHSLTFVELQ